MSAEEDKTPAKAGKETVYVDVEDEITSIIDKVENAKASVVALVLPKRAATLQSIVNMRLLKRAADSASKEVVLVTSEAALLPLAGVAKLHVAKNLQSKPAIPPAPGMPAEPAPTPSESEDGTGKVDLAKDSKGTDPEELPKKISYDKSIGELASAHEIEHPETIEIGDDEDAVETAAAKTEKLPKAPKDKALKVPNFDKFRLWIMLGIAGVVALIIFIFLAIFVLPKATISIDTTTTPVSTNLTLNTSDTAKTLDETKQIIPATLKTSDQSSTTTVNATGQQNNGTKATGSVTMSATECGSVHSASDVSAGTGVSSSGLTYVTQSNTHFSSSGTVSGTCITYPATSSTAITAQNGGAKYNAPSGTTFAVFGRNDVSATGSASGGTDNVITVVGQNDLDNAKKSVTSTQTDAYTKTFENQLGSQGYYVLTSTFKLSDTTATASPDVGQQASSTTVTLKTTYSVLCVKKDDLTKAIQDAVAGQIDKSKQKVEDSDILAGAQVSVTNQSSPTIATLNITESTQAVPIIEASNVQKQAAGQKSGDITASLSTIPGVKDVNVKLSPFWVSKAPKSQSKITVVLNRVSTKNGQ